MRKLKVEQFEKLAPLAASLGSFRDEASLCRTCQSNVDNLDGSPNARDRLLNRRNTITNVETCHWPDCENSGQEPEAIMTKLFKAKHEQLLINKRVTICSTHVQEIKRWR
jgi:hypothetical protein